MLKLVNIFNGYGDCEVLFGVSLVVGKGQAVSLLGRNGMGKTTTVASIMGILPARSGIVHFRDCSIQRLAPYKIARLGIGLVPEGRRVFPTLTVRENLVAIASRNKEQPKQPWIVDSVLALFPALQSRVNSLAGLLSGGEQQMLAIGRALMINPQLLILDEATEGLAPLIRAEIWKVLSQLKADGMSILVIDKNLGEMLPIVDRHYVLEKGQIVWSGSSEALRSNTSVKERYLALGGRTHRPIVAYS